MRCRLEDLSDLRRDGRVRRNRPYGTSSTKAASRVVTGSPADFAAFIADSVARYSTITAVAAIEPQ